MQGFLSESCVWGMNPYEFFRSHCLMVSNMIFIYLKSRNRHFNLIHYLFSLFFFVELSGCTSLPMNSYARNLAEKYAREAALPVLEKIYIEQVPIQVASLGAFEEVQSIPGGVFKPVYQKNSLAYGAGGILQLGYGDYVIPVMTYCMKVSGGSPSGYVYSLSRLQGTRAGLIRALNQKALSQFSPNDIQILSWSLQAGLSYDELTPQSMHIFNSVLPERKIEIKESFLDVFQNKWNQISEKTDGVFPSFSSASDDFLSSLGGFGDEILMIRNFQKTLTQYGNDYSKLSSAINDGILLPHGQKVTGWNKINDQIYARFLTNGHYQDVGQIQIRVVDNHKRKPGSASQTLLPIDIGSWLADPNNYYVQPLSFSMILSSEGVFLGPEIIDAPLFATALLSALLANQVVDWDAFNQLKDFLSDVKDTKVRNLIRNGDIALNKAYDDLEKPARDVNVIDKNTEKSPDRKDSNTREYKKSGGAEQLGKDFDKISGRLQNTQDGTSIKQLPDGKTIVKRSQKNENLPTLEIQPIKTGIKGRDQIRIKVRYYP
jgi:hypothetical protein